MTSESEAGRRRQRIHRVKELERENARLQRRLARVETMLEIQKKTSELLGIPLNPLESDRTTDRGGRGAGGADWANGGSLRGSGVARSTLYRRRQPVTSKPKRRPRPHRALDETEREEVLGALHCERFVDKCAALRCKLRFWTREPSSARFDDVSDFGGARRGPRSAGIQLSPIRTTPSRS